MQTDAHLGDGEMRNRGGEVGKGPGQEVWRGDGGRDGGADEKEMQLDDAWCRKGALLAVIAALVAEGVLDAHLVVENR